MKILKKLNINKMLTILFEVLDILSITSIVLSIFFLIWNINLFTIPDFNSKLLFTSIVYLLYRVVKDVMNGYIQRKKNIINNK